MTERVSVPCLVCGEEIVFEVEDWADPPTRAFCNEECYGRHQATPEATRA